MSNLGRLTLPLIPVLAGIAYDAPARAESLPAMTQAHARFTLDGKSAGYLVLPNVRDTITVASKGGNYPQGGSLNIATVNLPASEVRTFDPLRVNAIPVSHEGQVVCLLLDPRGDLDGFLLNDGTLVRVRPAVPNPQLTVGSNVRAEGEGTSAFIRADKVTLTSTGTVLDLSTPPRAVRVPRVLMMLDGSSTILRVVNDREGRIDTLVLQDGSIVKLPPTLRDQAGDSLTVGTKLTARGKGGTYGQVKAFRAVRLQLASGQVFAEPERRSPPRR
jgi:hypothetical protein